MFKICSKHYQLLLVEVCIEFISPYQSAFVLGHTIHHALLLTAKALHQAARAEDFLFLKLNVKKAFNSLEWEFLFVVLQKFGFGPNFISYIKAATVGAASKVLNGRFTSLFPISRPIRQGCPLSALLFVIVNNVLSSLLTSVVEGYRLYGVQFPEHNIQTAHGIYADDVYLIIEDREDDLIFCQQLFNNFGDYSGLYYDWERTKATFLLNDNIPYRLLDLGWTWEDELTATKPFGIHMGHNIVPGLMVEQLRTCLEHGLQHVGMNPLSLIGRVTAINTLITSSLWFAITLWAGSLEDLPCFEKEIIRFLWSGQGRHKCHRFVEAILYLPRSAGSLGIISIQQQMHALTGKCILWSLIPKVHPLRQILEGLIELALKRWGMLDFSWVFVPCNTLPTSSPNIWLNICRS